MSASKQAVVEGSGVVDALPLPLHVVVQPACGPLHFSTMTDGRGGLRAPSYADIDSLAGRPLELDRTLCELARNAGSGDRIALETLLYAIDSQRLAEPGVRRVLFEPDDVDDVLQDVLVAVAENAGSFRGESRFTSWLFGVGRNKAKEFLRRKRDTAEFRTELGDSERISSLIASQISIRDLLAELPPHYRQAVTMRDVQGMAYADIAGSLDLKINTVRTHIARGRALLVAYAASTN